MIIFDKKNYYRHSNNYVEYESYMSLSDYSLANFKAFLEIVRKETQKGDTRTIYIDGFFDRIDESVNITPILNELMKLHRPIMILN